MKPKILLLDIETSPNQGYFWGLWKQNIAISQVIDSGSVLCWAAKWLGEKEVLFRSNQTGHRRMLKTIHKLLDEADAVVHYYGTNFDIPQLNREFLKAGLGPPSPFKQVDLCRVAKSKFKFLSNKLAYIAKYLDIATKYEHSGFQMWVDCMNGDREAWKEMEHYNRQDVIVLEQVYYKFLPWIQNHFNHSVFHGKISCPNCGSFNFQNRGYHLTSAGKYQRHQCTDCSKWFQSGKSMAALPAEKAKGI